VHELYPAAKVDVERDLQPVSIMGLTPMVLLTHKDVPVTDYASLVRYLKAHPNELTTGSNGRGSAGHLAGALFKKMAGVDVRYIPYRTTPQAQADLIGGRLSMMWLSTLTDHIQAGTLRPIAVSTLARWKLFPDTPTFDELGLKGYEAATWVSMYLPKGAPQDVIEKLNTALVAALADPAVRERLDQVGVIVPPTTGPEFNKKYLRYEVEKWSDILRTNKDAD
jgi:tripartite-type tricarboxylate transporter receptor subunit TctC